MFTLSTSVIGNISAIKTLVGGVSYAAITKQMQEKLEECANEFKDRTQSGLKAGIFGLAENSPWTVAAWKGTTLSRRSKKIAVTKKTGGKTPMIMSSQVVDAIKVKEVSTRRIAANEAAYFIGVPKTSKLHRVDGRSRYGKMMVSLHHKPITIYGVTEINTREGGYYINPFGNKSKRVHVPSRDFFTPSLRMYKPEFQSKMYEGVAEGVQKMFMLNSVVGVTTLTDLQAMGR